MTIMTEEGYPATCTVCCGPIRRDDFRLRGEDEELFICRVCEDHLEDYDEYEVEEV